MAKRKIRNSRISERYAKALWLLAQNDLNLARQRQEKLSSMIEVFEVPKLRPFLLSPVVPIHLKVDILNKVLNQLQADPLLQRFVEFVCHARRVELLPSITWAYVQILDQQENLVHVELQTATQLNADEQERIAQSLKRLFRAERLDIELSIDQGIFGGFIVRAGDAVIDLSLKKKVDRLLINATD